MKNILLNPGPANTTLSVKLAQVVEDICPREEEFGRVMEEVSKGLVEFVEGGNKARAVLFGGSGTLAVEACISSVVGSNDKLAIVINGAYGQRIADMAKYAGINYVAFESDFLKPIDFAKLDEFLQREKPQFLALIHSETTSGLINDLDSISRICKPLNIKIIADCMSSYACYPLSLDVVDFIIASSNKNIQGMAGISFVIANEANILKATYAKSLYLDLKAQYEYFIHNYQMRFTPPVQTLYALRQAIGELKREGLTNRYKRYEKSNKILRDGLTRLGFDIYPKNSYGVIIAAITLPNDMEFNELHSYCKERGYTIYPGKIAGLNMFRIANIGDIESSDLQGFLDVLESFIKLKK